MTQKNPEKVTQKVQGRLIRQDGNKATIQSEKSKVEIEFTTSAGNPIPGDIVEYSNNNLKKLTQNRTQTRSTKWMNRVLDLRRMRAVKIRDQVENGIRDYFKSQGFHETRTPLLVQCPGMETHIRPFRVSRTTNPGLTTFLPTSPEFAMKRLLVGGLERIFQLCPVFRDEPFSPSHFPEFTMLEWYRAYAGYEEIMEDTERLFESLAVKLLGRPVIRYQGQEISVKAPWPRLRVRDLFQERAGVDLVQLNTRELLAAKCTELKLPVNSEDTWDDLYFKIWLNLIEPALPQDQAVFVIRYPASQAALAVLDQDEDGSRWARRFEAYAGGLELCNAFEELTDPIEQRKRFIEDMELREKTYGPEFPKNPLDEEFLEALEEGMPPSGGIAIGVDRMVMLLADEPEIDYTFWLRPHS